MGFIEFDAADHVATITLNRPEKMNALNAKMLVDLCDAWARIESDPDIRVAVVRAVPGKAFCAGADLGALVPLLQHAREPQDEWEAAVNDDPAILNRALLRTSRFRVPIIAGVDGIAFAGGMELMMACDLRVATERSRFGLTEVSRGLLPAGGGLARLSKQVSYAFATRIAILGEAVSASDAYAHGLISHLVLDGQLESRLAEIAQQLASNGPVAVEKAKEVLVLGAGMSLSESLHLETEAAQVVMATLDAREGPKAFMEKRQPNFVGR